MRNLKALALSAALVLSASAAQSQPLLPAVNADPFGVIATWISSAVNGLLGLWEKGTSCIDPNGTPIPCPVDPDPNGGNTGDGTSCIDPNGVPCVLPPKP